MANLGSTYHQTFPIIYLNLQSIYKPLIFLICRGKKKEKKKKSSLKQVKVSQFKNKKIIYGSYNLCYIECNIHN